MLRCDYSCSIFIDVFLLQSRRCSMSYRPLSLFLAVLHLFAHTTLSAILPATSTASNADIPAALHDDPVTFESRAALPPVYNPRNNFSCTSTQPDKNPLVFLHGLGSTYYEDIGGLENYLKTLGFCTFSFTYGAIEPFPLAGGIEAIKKSAPGIAAFIKEVKRKTGSAKVDLVGHSEGAFQALYVPKFYGVSSMVDKIIAIAAPVHGTTFGGLYKPSVFLGNFSGGVTDQILEAGCAACDDLLIDGAAVKRLNDGRPIVQPGNKLTTIASRLDNEVTPRKNAFVQEPGVTNWFVQDFCSSDTAGHLSEAVDFNIWRLVINALNRTPRKKFVCVPFGGPPVR